MKVLSGLRPRSWCKWSEKQENDHLHPLAHSQVQRFRDERPVGVAHCLRRVPRLKARRPWGDLEENRPRWLAEAFPLGLRAGHEIAGVSHIYRPERPKTSVQEATRPSLLRDGRSDQSFLDPGADLVVAHLAARNRLDHRDIPDMSGLAPALAVSLNEEDRQASAPADAVRRARRTVSSISRETRRDGQRFGLRQSGQHRNWREARKGGPRHERERR